MADWMIWLILAGALVILELFSGTFYLLMIAIGLACGALAALGGASIEAQLIVAAVVGAVSTMILHRSRFGRGPKVDSAHDPNVNLDIGQTVTIDAWNDAAGGQPTARIVYRGAPWDVDLAPHAVAVPGRFTIREIRGSRLIVTNHR